MVFIYLILGIILLIGITLFIKSSNLLSVESDETISKKISFNRDSWHFWYYSNVFSKEQPKVLCPYYWTMVFLILFSPLILPFLGIKKIFFYIGSKFESNKPKVIKVCDYDKELRKLKTSEIIGKVIFIIVIVGLLILIVCCFYDGVTKYGWLHILKGIGIGILVALGIILSIVFFYYTFKGFRYVCLKLYYTNFIQVPKQMVVAIYKRACPIIEWKN